MSNRTGESEPRGYNKQSNPHETKNVHVGEEAQRASLPPANLQKSRHMRVERLPHHLVIVQSVVDNVR